jgi:hypothetical protein
MDSTCLRHEGGGSERLLTRLAAGGARGRPIALRGARCEGGQAQAGWERIGAVMTVATGGGTLKDEGSAGCRSAAGQEAEGAVRMRITISGGGQCLSLSLALCCHSLCAHGWIGGAAVVSASFCDSDRAAARAPHRTALHCTAAGEAATTGAAPKFARVATPCCPVPAGRVPTIPAVTATLIHSRTLRSLLVSVWWCGWRTRGGKKRQEPRVSPTVRLAIARRFSIRDHSDAATRRRGGREGEKREGGGQRDDSSCHCSFASAR